MKSVIQNSQKQHMDMQVGEIMQEHKRNSLRIPFAECACLKLHGEHGDEFEDDFIILADIFNHSILWIDKRDDAVKSVIKFEGA